MYHLLYKCACVRRVGTWLNNGCVPCGNCVNQRINRQEEWVIPGTHDCLLYTSKMGFLKERKATSYPSKEAELFGAEVVKDSVVVSDFIITSRGLGTAIDFSLALIGLLLNKEKAEEIKDSVIYQCK